MESQTAPASSTPPAPANSPSPTSTEQKQAAALVAAANELTGEHLRDILIGVAPSVADAVKVREVNQTQRAKTQALYVQLPSAIIFGVVLLGLVVAGIIALTNKDSESAKMFMGFAIALVGGFAAGRKSKGD